MRRQYVPSKLEGPMTDLNLAVLRALETLKLNEASVRQLARKAGVPHTTLNRIKAGTENATPSVAAKVAAALEAWAAEYQDAAHGVRRALSGKGRKR